MHRRRKRLVVPDPGPLPDARALVSAARRPWLRAPGGGRRRGERRGRPCALRPPARVGRRVSYGVYSGPAADHHRQRPRAAAGEHRAAARRGDRRRARRGVDQLGRRRAPGDALVAHSTRAPGASGRLAGLNHAPRHRYGEVYRWNLGRGAGRRDGAAALVTGRRRGSPLPRQPRRERQLRGAHRAAHVGLPPAARRAVRERPQGDADGRLPQPARGPRPAAARARPPAASADDPPLRQHDRVLHPEPRRQPGLRRLARRVGMRRFTPVAHPGATRSSTRPTRRASSCTSSGTSRNGTAAARCGCCTRSSPRSDGASRRSRRAAGSCTSKGDGGPDRGRSITRSHCSAEGACASRWRL